MGVVFFSIMEVFPTSMSCQARGEQRGLARQRMTRGLGEGGPPGWWEVRHHRNTGCCKRGRWNIRWNRRLIRSRNNELLRRMRLLSIHTGALQIHVKRDSLLSTQTVVSTHHFPWEETRIPRRTSWFWVCYRSLGILSCQARLVECCLMVTRDSSSCIPLVKDGNVWASKRIIITMDWNIWNR